MTSEIVSVGKLCGLALWRFGCHLACRVLAIYTSPRTRSYARGAAQLAGFLVLVAASAVSFGQTATSSVMPANPTYVDAVTGILTISAVAGQPPITTTITYSVDSGAEKTATVTTGTNSLNLGQLSLGTHALSIGSPGEVTKFPPPPPVTFPVVDQSFAFVGIFGHFYPSYTDSNFITARAVAIDSNDKVYIADNSANKIAVFDIFENITTLPITTLPFPIAGPTGLAFDSSDNLFISDSGNSRVVKYTPAGVETLLSIPGLGKPGQLVLNKAKNLLYIVDQDNDRVLLYDLTKMAEAGEAFAGATQIQSIALDPGGTLYLSDNLLGFLKGSSITTVLGTYAPIEEPGGIYVDRAGFLYLSDAETNAVFRIDSQGHQTQISDLGNPSFGAAEDSQGRIILPTGGPNIRTFSPNGSVDNASLGGGDDQFNSLIYTVPQGQTSLTATAVPPGTFTARPDLVGCPFVSITGTCALPVEFTPTAPGERVGNVSTTLLNGPTIATLIHGVGEGPAPAFLPGTQTQRTEGATLSSGVALDQVGNYYVSDSASNRVLKSSGGATSPLSFTGLSSPSALAIDGAGAVYVLDDGNHRIAKLSLSGSQTAPVVAGAGNPLSAISSFAIDGGGRIYFAGPTGSSNSIYLKDTTGATSLVASGLATSTSLALDPYGNIYSLQGDGSLVRIDIHGSVSTLAAAGAFPNPVGLAVDASETAYVARSGIAAVTLVHPDEKTALILIPSLGHPAGIAIDGKGDILGVDSATNNFIFVDRTHQDFNFGNVPVNTTRTFVSLLGNSGTQPFTITGLPGDSDFRQVTAPDACAASGTNATVAPASECNLSYTVAPTTLGLITAPSRVTTNVSSDSDTFTENVVAVQPTPTVSPTSLSFGNVTVGATSKSQMVTVTNTASVPLTPTTIGITGAGFTSLASGTTCKAGVAIAGGSSCTYALFFSPAVTGAVSGSLTIGLPDGFGVASLVVPISGAGIAPPPSATLTPTTYNFGNVGVGVTAEEVFTFTNTGTTPITFNEFLAQGNGFGVSAFTSATCVTITTLQPGASCTVGGLFSPTTAGPATGSLQTQIAGGATITANLTGIGIAATGTLTPTPYNFGNVGVGATAEEVFTFTNTGIGPIKFKAIQSQGNGFGVTFSTTCSLTSILQPGASCLVGGMFSPITAGPATGSLQAQIAGGATVTANLTGTGVAATGTLTPTPYNFGNVGVGATAQEVFTFTNTGIAPIKFKAIQAQGNEFGLTFSTTCSTIPPLQPGASCLVGSIFSPTTAGPTAGSLQVQIAGGATITANLTGTGVAPTATLTPTTYNFGTVGLGEIGYGPFTLTNTGIAPITFTELKQGNEFDDPSTTCGVLLQPGTSCTLYSTFSPTTAGPATGSLQVKIVGGPSYTANLIGTGAGDPVLSLTPSTYNFGTLLADGSTYTQALTLANSGTAAATVSLTFAETAPGLLPTDQPNSFGNTTNCGVTLAIGASCTITISFTPKADSSSIYTVQATGNSGATPVTATLTGAGLLDAPRLAFSPTFSTLGPIPLGSTVTQVVTMTNTGGQTANFNVVEGFADDGVEVDLVSTTCTNGVDSFESTLAPGESCNFIVAITAFSNDTYGAFLFHAYGRLGTNSVFSQVYGYTGTAVTNPLIIDYGNGFNNFMLDSLALNGPATVSNSVLQLTTDQPSQASSAFYSTAVPTNRFTSDLAFQLLDPMAEGITFTIQGDGPNAVGSSGGGLGYQGIAKSIALKFDLRNTSGEGADSTGIYVNGAAPTEPSISLANSGIDLHSGHVFALHLAYDGTTEAITLTDPLTKAVWTTSVAEDIPSIVGKTAYFGFTAATGATAAAAAVAKPATTSNILYWNYINQNIDVTGKNAGTAQTITFPALAGKTYGASPLSLAATATSGLAVTYIVSGPAKIAGSTLTITGAGTVAVTATQAGNATFAAAGPVTQSFLVAKAPLTVTATNLSREYGQENPTLTYTVTGFADGDTTGVVGGNASLATSAISTSPVGSYPITFTNEGLSAVNYSFTYVAGTLTVSPANTQCTVVDYSQGFTSEGLTLNGSTKIAGGLLELTDGHKYEVASAFSSAPLPLSSFVTDFTFQLLNPHADGITFTIQAAGPKALGEAGGGLGYAGIPKSVALKFDLFSNAGEGTNSTGIYNNGAYPSQPSIPLDGLNVDLHSGHIFQIHISYDGKESAATLTDTVTGVVLKDIFPGDIMGVLGASSAYFGFTGATGGESATQNILSWTYTGGSGCPANL